MAASIDRRTAARIIHSLAESGQPPKLGAAHLNVGTDEIIGRIKSEYLEDLLTPYEGQDGAGVCKWIEANYGNGKTQFLRCMQGVAWDLNYVTSFVELSQDECPLDHPERIYAAVARGLQARPLSPADVDRGRGIEITFQQLFDRSFPGVLSGNANDDTRSQALLWLDTSLAATPVESSGLKVAVQRHLRAKIDGDAESATLAAAFLRGEARPVAEYRKIGIHEKLDKTTGFRLLRSLCQLLQRSELATGTALLFDEARRSLSLLSSKAEKVACENLLTIINRCNSGEFPGTLFMYAVMPEFFTDFAVAYPALQQRCGPNSRINLEELRGVQEIDLLQKIGVRITDIYQTATGEELPKNKVLSSNLRNVAEHSLKQAMVGSGRRRLFVKSWVLALKQYQSLPTAQLSEEELGNLVDGAKNELDVHERDLVAADGE